MKTLSIATLVVTGILATSLTVLAQGGPTAAPRGVAGTGTPVSADCPVYATAPAGTLAAAEADGLIYMREEEKLAHDVYVTLAAQWDLPIFANIAASEQTHADAVANLLTRYGIDDPAAGNGVGVFTNTALQSLYDQLVARGSQSLSDALKVGAAIEEIDILDLQSREAVTTQADIVQVFSNLEQASTNHLRSFVSTLAVQTGEQYAPQYLEDGAYDAIISSTVARGRR